MRTARHGWSQARRAPGRPRFASTFVLLLLACAGYSATLDISIRHTVNGEPVELGSMRHQNSAGETFSITRASYLLSGLALERGDGSWLEFTNLVAWMDAEAGRTVWPVPEVPSEPYRSLRFHVGPDDDANHGDPAKLPADHPLNPNLNGLHWNWQGGYIFLALEGRWAAADRKLDGFSFHLARDTNRVRIDLAGALDLQRDTRLELDFDLAPLLNTPRPISFAKDGSSTHSRDGDPLAASLAANLPGAFRVRRVMAGETTPASIARVKPLYLPEKFTPYRFAMSAVFPVPDLPRDNPLIAERVALGEKLFQEPLLSSDGKISCASCHEQRAAFSDPRRYSMGVRNQTGARQAMPLFNLAWKKSFFWDGRAASLRAQVLMPIQDHTEMDESLTNVVAKLGAKNYGRAFGEAFDSSEITPEKIALALESFLLTLTSFDSKFDRAMRGEARLTEPEQRGFELFMTEYDPRREQYGADCFHCHGGALFQSQTFANNGLDMKFTDWGRARITGRDADAGKFSTPSLRNIALTAPYMHDGRFATLEEVIGHYSAGVQRSATLDPNLAKHPDGGLHLSAEDRRALVAFLRTLTDVQYQPVEAPGVPTSARP